MAEEEGEVGLVGWAQGQEAELYARIDIWEEFFSACGIFEVEECGEAFRLDEVCEEFLVGGVGTNTSWDDKACAAGWVEEAEDGFCEDGVEVDVADIGECEAA